MTEQKSSTIAVKEAILFAIRDGKFLDAFIDQNFSEPEFLAGVHALSKQRYIVVTKLGMAETGEGEDFVLLNQSFKTIPQEAELTLDGERFVDQKRGIDSALLENSGKISLLEALLKGDRSSFEYTQMPDGIGPQRKAFLAKEIVQEGLVETKRQVRQPGFFQISHPVLVLTPSGSKKLAEEKYGAASLEKAFKQPRRQLLLSLLEKKGLPISSAAQTIQPDIPGWGQELFAAMVQPLLDAGIVVKANKTVRLGFLDTSVRVLELGSEKDVVATIKSSENKDLSKTVKTSGQDISTAIMRDPNVSLEVRVPQKTSGPNQSSLLHL